MASVSFQQHREILRHAPRSSTASASTSTTASSWSSSARRAAASPRCCACSRASRRSRGGTIAIDGKVVNDVESKDRDIAMVFQSYALYPHMTVARQHGASASSCARPSQGVIAASAWRNAAKILNLDPLPGALSARAVGRPAAARGHGPRDRARSQGVPVRRAAVQPRRQAARGDARRDQGAAPAAEDHHRVRHARPDRGDDHGRPHRGHARRAHRADRRAAGAVRPARTTCSSRSSSARRR